MADQATRPLRAAERRPLSLRLLGGLVAFVTTLYHAPKRRTGKDPVPKKAAKRDPRPTGLHSEMTVLGFSKGVSAALVSRIGRMTALLQSFARAAAELAQSGVELATKEVHRIATQLGQEILTTRRRDLEWYRSGTMPVGTELRGKRVGVALDGGRTKLRKLVRKQKGQGKTKTRRRKWKTEWREPKVLIIFEHDDNGRMTPKTRPWMAATFQGPDEFVELLAMYLHRLGACEAASVTFLADGAPWVWERLAWVEKRVALPADRVTRVLDFCHAVHQMSLALKQLNLPKVERDALYRKLRIELKASRTYVVTGDLSERALAAGLSPESEVWTHIRYLENHAQRGRMQYRKFRRGGLPIGSGAIESGVRRLVNLRLKGNGIAWYEGNAEGMMAMRAAALTERWEETLDYVRETMSRDRSLGWEWTSPAIPELLKSGVAIGPPKPEVLAEQGSARMAA